VVGWLLSCPEAPPKAVLQISHGMCEYAGRYAPFAAFMARQGYAVCMHDHLGHGETSSLPGGVDGYFGGKRGAAYLLRDLKAMNDRARRAFPGLPVLVLGHSMGSFFARWMAECWPEAMDGLLLSGTAGPNPFCELGLALTTAIRRAAGPFCRPQSVQRLAFGAYLRRIPDPDTPFDWISRDKEVVARYNADPKCNFVFTVGAFHELFWVLRQVNRPQWYRRVPRGLPIRLFSGDADPVGDYGRGVCRVYEGLKATGHRDLALRLYPGGRHEMLNETNRAQVYQDLLAWCEGILGNKGR